MDTDWRSGQATGGGLLPEARGALRDATGQIDRLAYQTAWECAAARQFRAELAALRGQLESLCRTADALEDELRGLGQQLLIGVG